MCYQDQTYSESAEGVVVSHERALRELEMHGVPADLYGEFYEECGFRDEYDAGEVLRHLGY